MRLPSITKRQWWGYEAVKAQQRARGLSTDCILSEMIIANAICDILIMARMEGFDAEHIALKALRQYQDDIEEYTMKGDFNQ